MGYAQELEKREIFRPVYVPAPHVPAWFAEELNRIGGRVPNGKPRLRVVWGMDERTFCAGDPRAIKYISPNDTDLGWACWILEQWHPPEFLGERDEWERQRYGWGDTGRIDILGDYPNQGSYWLFKALITPAGEPLMLNRQTLNWIEEIAYDSMVVPNAEHLRRIQERVLKEKAERLKRSQEQRDILYDEMNTKGQEIDRKSQTAYPIFSPTTKIDVRKVIKDASDT